VADAVIEADNDDDLMGKYEERIKGAPVRRAHDESAL
jgi:hypothetical protein